MFDCVIEEGAYVENSVSLTGKIHVGKNVRIYGDTIITGDDVSLTGSTTLYGCYIQGNVLIHSSIIREGVGIANNVSITNCMVAGQSCIVDDAKISNARLTTMIVSGDAVITGGNWHMGKVITGTFATPALWIQGSRYAIGWSGGHWVSSGCITRPIDWWCANLEECAVWHGYTPAQVREYRMYVDLLARYIEERS